MSKSESPRLWIICESFYPEEVSTSYILTKVAELLSQKYEVRIICGPVNSIKGMANMASYQHPLVQITRLRSINPDTNKISLRLLKFILLSLQLFIYSVFHIRKNDKVLIVTNPVILLLFISFYRRIKKFDLNILIHDVFPENAIPAKIISSNCSLFYRFLKYLFDKAYASADTLIVLGRDMKHIVEQKIKAENNCTSISIIENWGDINNIQVIPFHNDNIVIQYAGNLGRVQGLLEFEELLKRVDNPILTFEFRGNGAVKTQMQEKMQELNLKNIKFFSPFSRDQQTEILGQCSLALVILAKGMYGLGIPSKTYNILAAGRPILYIGDSESEIALMIKEYQVGFCFDTEDDTGLVSFFNSMQMEDLEKLEDMGQRARLLVESRYSQEVILNKFLQVI